MFWRERLKSARQLHHAVFVCPADKWRRIETKHAEILRRNINPYDSILDAGCAWGRLLDLLPKYWIGRYVGVDLCPDLVELARKRHPNNRFIVGNLISLKHLLPIGESFDWAVMISMRPMIKRNLGNEYWELVRDKVLEVADRILYLECDENCNGFIEKRV